MNHSNIIQSRGFLLRSGDLSVRPLQDRATDFAALLAWLQNPKVQEFYGGRDQTYTLIQIEEKYSPQTMAKAGKIPCLIEFLERPVGYLQVSALGEKAYREFGYPQDENIFGLDLFIGETALWGCGLGRRALTCACSYLFTTLRANRVVVDPHADNLRAIRSYIAAGFHKVKLLPKHECHEGCLVDCWLMEKVCEKAVAEQDGGS